MRAHRAIRFAAVVVSLIVAIEWLRHIGRGALATPPLSPLDLRVWLESRDAITATAAAVRLIAIACALYLLVITVLSTLAQSTRSVSLRRITTRLSPHFLQSVLGGVATLGLIGGSPSEPAPARSPNTLVELPSEPEVATIIPLPDEPSPSIAETAPVPEVEIDSTWTVESGESFWSIARELVDESLGRPATDNEIFPYWTELIEANRTRLIDPEQVDLLYPGQELEVPVVAPGA